MVTGVTIGNRDDTHLQITDSFCELNRNFCFEKWIDRKFHIQNTIPITEENIFVSSLLPLVIPVTFGW